MDRNKHSTHYVTVWLGLGNDSLGILVPEYIPLIVGTIETIIPFGRFSTIADNPEVEALKLSTSWDIFPRAAITWGDFFTETDYWSFIPRANVPG